MAYINPMLLSMDWGDNYPIQMPDSGGIFIANPGGKPYYEFRFKDGGVAYYDVEGNRIVSPSNPSPYGV